MRVIPMLLATFVFSTFGCVDSHVCCLRPTVTSQERGVPAIAEDRVDVTEGYVKRNFGAMRRAEYVVHQDWYRSRLLSALKRVRQGAPVTPLLYYALRADTEQGVWLTVKWLDQDRHAEQVVRLYDRDGTVVGKATVVSELAFYSDEELARMSPNWNTLMQTSMIKIVSNGHDERHDELKASGIPYVALDRNTEVVGIDLKECPQQFVPLVKVRTE